MIPALDTATAATATPDLRVTCVHDLQGLAALRPEWNRLLGASAARSPFLTWEWLHSWWRHLSGTAALRIVVVSAGDRPVGIAPLMVTHGTMGWFPRLEFLGTGDAGSDYLDFIVRSGHESAVLDAFVGFFDEQRLSARFDHAPADSLGARAAGVLEDEGWTALTVPGGVCPVINLAGHTWDSYLGTVGSAHRANVRRRLRALERQFTVSFERVTTDAERRVALSALCRFHEWRFEADGSTAFTTPSLRAFHDEATREALDAGWLRLYVLRLNDTVAAVMYGLSYGDQFYFYQHGFDQQFQRHSVGLVLMALSIRAALDEGLSAFDLLWGTEAYKWLWTRDARPLHRIDLFPAHLAGRLRQGAVHARRRLGPLARRVLTLGESRGA